VEIQLTIFAYISLVFMFVNPVGSPQVSDNLACFENVPRAFTQVPFWFWNGPLDPNQFRGTARAEPSGILGPAYLWLEQ